MTRSLLSAQRDASRRVAEAQKFSIRLPFIGPVRVPPPDQLAFYGVLGGLAALELIDWPVALAMALGSAVVSRHLTDLEEREEDLEAAAHQRPTLAAPPEPEATGAPAKKAPTKKAPAKTTAKKTPAKTAAKKTVKKTPAKKTPATKRTPG